MIRSVVLLAFIALSAAVLVPANDPHIRYEGRVQFEAKKNRTVEFDWSGVTISFRFSGSSFVRAVLEDVGNIYNVILNGDRVHVLNTTTGDNEYTLATGLKEDKVHHLLITKRTEARYGVVRFYGFEIDDNGKVHDRATTRDRRIQFIGDSITCGYGDLGNASEPATCPEGDKALTEDNWISWGPLISDYLLAAYEIVAWSGKGLVKNCCGEKGLVMPDYWNRTLATVNAGDWNFTSWVPDAVVINLGTNDYNGNATESDFEHGYVEFVKTINESYSTDPTFFLACGPMIDLPFCDYVSSVVNNLTDIGFNAHFVNLTDILDYPQDFGCASHPNAQGHQLMARETIISLRKYMGW